MRFPGGRIGRQIALLVLTNAFVGAMVGLERTIVPLLAEDVFGIASRAAALSFIVTFGVAKAVVNAFAGHWSQSAGRRPILVAGWLVAIPIPLVLMWAPSWGWIVAANVLLGINQGLTWSMTVVMEMDLAPPKRRGIVLGLTQFAGYAGLASIALVTGLVASTWGLRPEPFYIGVAIAAGGFLLSLFASETRQLAAAQAGGPGVGALPLREVVRRCSWSDPALSATSLAGLATNLKDGVLWGLLPLHLAALGLSVGRIATVVAVYPAVWAVAQLVTGPLADRTGRKPLIVVGLGIQAAGVLSFFAANQYPALLGAAVLTGLGTALAYPALLAFVSDVAAPGWRASALGVFRFWRDLGYAAGALGAGIIADAYGIPAALGALVAFLVLSTAVMEFRGRERPAA